MTSNNRISPRPPPRPPPPKFVVFMTFKLPDSADGEEMLEIIIKWTKDFRREKERLPSSFELRKYIKKKHSIALMIDQRVTEGEKIPFFGKPALTTTLPAQLSIKFGLYQEGFPIKALYIPDIL